MNIISYFRNNVVSNNSFDRRFGSASVLRRYVSRCKAYFSGTVDMHTKHTNFPVTGVIGARFLYLSNVILIFLTLLLLLVSLQSVPVP